MAMMKIKGLVKLLSELCKYFVRSVSSVRGLLINNVWGFNGEFPKGGIKSKSVESDPSPNCSMPLIKLWYL